MAAGMLHAAETILGPQPGVRTLSVGPGLSAKAATSMLSEAVEAADEGAGVLILTDLLGGTPCNLASLLLSSRVDLVAGFNLPALLKGLLSRAVAESPTALAKKMVSHGIEYTTTGSDMLQAGLEKRG